MTAPPESSNVLERPRDRLADLGVLVLGDIKGRIKDLVGEQLFAADPVPDPLIEALQRFAIGADQLLAERHDRHINPHWEPLADAMQAVDALLELRPRVREVGKHDAVGSDWLVRIEQRDANADSANAADEGDDTASSIRRLAEAAKGVLPRSLEASCRQRGVPGRLLTLPPTVRERSG